MKRILKPLLLVAIIIASSFSAISAEGPVTIKGKLLDKKNSEPLPFANVTLYNSQKSIVTGTTSKENGEFMLSAALSGGDTLHISFIGYNDIRIGLSQSAANGAAIDLGTIEVEPQSQTLQAAVVTAKVPLIEQKLDKIVVNVSQSVVAATSNAFELLKKSPGVTVDLNGNIQLNGQSVEIWIDGRPSKLSGSQLETVLTALNGSTIDKIEIMQHPSAKFDASGSGGIINIKTKRNFVKGLYGSASINYSMVPKLTCYDNGDASLLVNYRSKRANTMLTYTFNNNSYGIDLDSENEFGPVFSYKQSSDSRIRGYNRGHFAKIGTDFYPNQKNTFGFLVNYNTSRNTQYTDGYSNSALYVNNILQSKSISYIDQLDHFDRIDANIYYIRNFSGVKELTLNADYGYYDTQNDGFQRNITTPAGGSQKRGAFTNDNSQHINIFAFKADYKCSPFKKAMLETGAKIETTWTDNNSIRRDSIGGAYVIDPNQSNIFKYRETIGALYGSLSYQINKKWSIVAGLRGEYTKSTGDWISDETKSHKDYFKLFPTIYVGYSPKNWRFSLSYTRRINRPSFSQLNPFRYYIDPTSSITGNPDINPAYTNSIAFVAGYKSYFNISAIYSHTSNLVSQIPNFDAVTGDKTFYWGNYGSQTVAGGVLSIMEYPLVKNLFYFSLNSLFASLENCTAENIEDLYEKESSFFMTHYFTLTTLLPRNWKVEFVGYYMNGARSGGMKVDNICNFYAGVKKELMDKRLTLSLSMNDLFNTFKMNIETITPTNRYILNQHQFQQRISFGIKYNFGKVQSGRKNNKRDNTSQRVGNSSGGGISAGGMGGM